MLRDYQQSAVDAIINSISKSTDKVMIEAATGAGKSHIIAAVASWISKQTDKKIICLAPSKELIEQNHSKYIATGNKASFYSASVVKCMRHQVVFATPMSFKNGIHKFIDNVSAIIIDECHNIGNTVKNIVKELKDHNDNLRVIGMTATPYRTKKGYIFLENIKGEKNTIENAIDPYFDKLLYRITAHDLIDKGFLTAPIIGESKESYDTSNLKLNSMGKFDNRVIEQTFEGKGRLTAEIIKDIVFKSANRKGVLIFCSTIDHAKEALESLPKGLSCIVTGKTNKRSRENILKRFKSGELKYLVNVAVLTTGFDAPHVDVIALLRATESPGLFQQIIGRGLRLHDNKKDCLILDYAENIIRHCPDGDLFDPDLDVKYSSASVEKIKILCPFCNNHNDFIPVVDLKNINFDEYGYETDLNGNRLTDDEGRYLSIHHGRRCQNYIKVENELVQCSHRWNSKECPECNESNDITARKCINCGTEIIDPNKKLTLDFKKFKSSPRNKQTDLIVSINADQKISMKGNDLLVIEFQTEYRNFKSYHTPLYESKWEKLFGKIKFEMYATIEETKHLINDHKDDFKTVTYQKKESGFYEIYGFNGPHDELEKNT